MYWIHNNKLCKEMRADWQRVCVSTITRCSATNMCVQLPSAPNKSIRIHQHAHTNKGTHSLVFIRQRWHSALRRRHTSQAQRREGNPDGKKRRKINQKKKEVKIRSEEETNAAEGRTTEKIKGKCDKAYLVSDPHHTGRAGEMLLLIATGSTCLSVFCLCICLSSASVCHLYLSVFLMFSSFYVSLCYAGFVTIPVCPSVCNGLCLSVCLPVMVCVCLSVHVPLFCLSPFLHLLSSFTDAQMDWHLCQTQQHESSHRAKESAEKTDAAAAGARQSGMLGAPEV